jgi:hypothetical protein
VNGEQRREKMQTGLEKEIGCNLRRFGGGGGGRERGCKRTRRAEMMRLSSAALVASGGGGLRSPVQAAPAVFVVKRIFHGRRVDE